MFPNIRALLRSHPILGTLLLIIVLPPLTIILALLPPLAFFMVSWVLWTAYFYAKDTRS